MMKLKSGVLGGRGGLRPCQQKLQQQQLFKLFAQSPPPPPLKNRKQSRSSLLNPPQADPSVIIPTKVITEVTTMDSSKEEKEEVYGAKFFGGSAVKEELFDAQIEEEMTKTKISTATMTMTMAAAAAARTLEKETVDKTASPSSSYSRFYDTQAFSNDIARQFGHGLQTILNHALYDLDEISDTTATTSTANTMQQSDVLLLYSTQNFVWETPFFKTTTSTSISNHNPIDEIQQALLFYKRLDIAIISCTLLSQSQSPSSSSSNLLTFQIRWAISLIWPNFLQSRVLLTGVSIMNVNLVQDDTKVKKNQNIITIISQTDSLDRGGKDGRDVIQAIAFQLQPRFWDLYHVGMTPSAEIMTRIYDKPTFKQGRSNNINIPIFSPSYSLFEIPPSLVYQTTLLDAGNREDRNAQYIPNHAFTSFIKTMGPKEQRYVPTSPVEIQIRRKSSVGDVGSTELASTSIITWTIQPCPEFLSYSDTLPLGMDHDEDVEEVMKDGTHSSGTTVGYSKYVYSSKRLVATMPHGGNPQDVDITDIRKKLYENVVRDGFKPKLDEFDKPIFFYLQNDVKTCFTSEGGLGMAVYDWRPKFVKSNEVGIELDYY